MSIDYTKLTNEELSNLINLTADYAELELIKQHLRKRLREKEKELFKKLKQENDLSKTS